MFTGLLSQNLQFFLAMTDKPIHATMPSGNDIEQKQSGTKFTVHSFLLQKINITGLFLKKSLLIFIKLPRHLDL